jgi:hypothetical protein
MQRLSPIKPIRSQKKAKMGKRIRRRKIKRKKTRKRKTRRPSNHKRTMVA